MRFIIYIILVCNNTPNQFILHGELKDTVEFLYHIQNVGSQLQCKIKKATIKEDLIKK